ncbi:hypothetical protein KGF57_003280 [Candida theae]|uniref:Importin N-terminal domain-containing protein n=1 Tax=Candida theae TaxID=1198502 RepID=A0AAD5BEE7_9ASCO|nr:uncharacterized protein KGF57_003280 [Candida theae]KAI5957586.1 hypothetical protein KGF57_003280 [Candida theae]
MDKDSLLQALSGTLNADQRVRTTSEQSLHVYEQQPGFTSYLLDLITEPGIQLGTQIAAAIFFKNRILNYWIAPENTKQPISFFLVEDEKIDIKNKLVPSLIKAYKINQIKFSLSTALNGILSYDKWDELVPIIKRLLSSQDQDQILVGLICLHEYVKNYRWAGLESKNFSNPVMDEVTQEVFPVVEQLAQTLVSSEGNYSTDEMLYLIVKSFKNATYSSLPQYFVDMNKLGLWCNIHISIINKPLPKEVLDEDIPEQRAMHPRVKAVKWCFANMSRLLNKHGGGYLTKDKSDFTQVFLTNFVPEILGAYWKIIEEWSSKKIWLSEASLFYMISFLELIIETPCWELVGDKLEAVVKHLILPSLEATNETVELYEDDTFEYIRRFFDVNREQKTSDVAAINFVYRLSNKKFKSTINAIFSLVNEIFTQRIGNRESQEVAMRTEGALRVLSTISFKLDTQSSPCYGQVDKMLETFVLPELSNESSIKTPWLTARACDTIAMFHNHQYSDMQVLQQIFQGIISCFQNESQFPVQLTAADALATLVQEDSVASHVSEQAPQLLENLLEKSKKYESDILTNVMDTFVEKFAKSLEPYAVELASKLVDQFVRLGNEILESQSVGTVETDKEYQASGLLSTLTTLILSTSHASKLGTRLETVVQPLLNFVLENAMVVFLTEIVEIMESLLYLNQEVSSTMWSIYQSVVDAFEIYAYEYFDSFQPFFVGIINKGFTNPQVTMEHPYVQSMMNVCFGILKQDDMDPIFAHAAFEDIELTILAMNTRLASILPNFLNEIFDIYQNLEAQDAFDGFMLHRLSLLRNLFAAIFVDPVNTMDLIASKGFTVEFYKLWIKHSDDFQSVYGCKLQMLASLSILKSDAVKKIQEDLVGETVDLLLNNVAALPNAIRAKNSILTNEISLKDQAKAEQKDEDGNDEYAEIGELEDEYEMDEAEMEALRETPIDNVNGFEEFVQAFLSIQQNEPERYHILFGDLDDSKKEMIQELVRVTQQARR